MLNLLGVKIDRLRIPDDRHFFW